MHERRRCHLLPKLLSGSVMLLAGHVALAHDPVVGMGPHVLFKGGVEVALELHGAESGSERENELGLELTYGVTGDWAIGAELPYRRKRDNGVGNDGTGDLTLFTKYRFWRRDSLGVQESAAIALRLKSDTGSSGGTPAVNPGATDITAGLAWGYESRKWYRWASLRYRHNGKNRQGLKRGDVVRLDFVGGIRPVPTGYLAPDTVWLLELNGEYRQRSKNSGVSVADSGGSEWFVSPGIFWTLRNFAIKAGVQIPVRSRLNGNQAKSDYRYKLTFEWHF